MIRSKTNQQHQRARFTLLQQGGMASGLGLTFLMAPVFFGSSPTPGALATAAGISGWLALVFGLALLGRYLALKVKAGKAARLLPRPKSRIVAKAPETLVQHQPASHWSSAVFAAIEWRRFEAVCEALFAQAGFETRTQSHGADGGVDIWLHSANAQGPVAVVQCKHWQRKPVGVKEIRAFFGVMASHQLKRGTYATTSTYTAEAKQFAKANGVNAMDGPALLALIAKRTPEQQQTLLAVAHEGEYWRPTCTHCGIKLVVCKSARSGTALWGCSNYPRCRYRRSLAAHQPNSH
jgi:restriction system protein